MLWHRERVAFGLFNVLVELKPRLVLLPKPNPDGKGLLAASRLEQRSCIGEIMSVVFRGSETCYVLPSRAPY